jgi:hypothetical protein
VTTPVVARVRAPEHVEDVGFVRCNRHELWIVSSVDTSIDALMGGAARRARHCGQEVAHGPEKQLPTALRSLTPPEYVVWQLLSQVVLPFAHCWRQPSSS